jgi:uncharacterized PurR-regulated membrane protein YhhQ (DUF165 family)
MRAAMYLGLYVGSVLLVNFLFAVVPPIPTIVGMFSPVAIIVGATFVLRDFAQRHAGHYVIVAMAVATALSFYLAAPVVAIASAVAFGVSELVDYAVYSYTKKPFHERVLISSVISTPVDTIVFLWWIDFLSVGTVSLMVLSKLLAAYILWAVAERKDIPSLTAYNS